MEDADDILEISRNKIYGRYVIAKRNIKQGELILKENPITVATQINGKQPICFKCCTIIKKFEICRKCGVALLCSLKCSGKFHTDEECNELSKLKINPNFLNKHPKIITPLKLLMVRNYSKSLWNRILEFESHLDARRNTEIRKQHEFFVESILKSLKIISEDDVRNEIIQKLCGILDVNTFEIRLPQNQIDEILNPDLHCLRGLYLKTALMAHSCISNTHLSVDDDFKMYVHASVDIPKGNMIFVNYSNVFEGNIERKRHLKEGKYFQCCCKRCLDPSELGTNISSLRCHKCENGIILPNINEEETISWICENCSKVFNKFLIESTLKLAKDIIEDIDPKNLEKLERTRMKLLKTFHPQHYLLLELEQNLVGLYSQSEASTENLSKKIEFCQNSLNVCKILEPGISRIQGITLYELHSAIANLAYKEHTEGTINSRTLLSRLKHSESVLRTSLKHLLYEPKKSPEGYLAQNALTQLKILRQSIGNLENQFKKE